MRKLKSLPAAALCLALTADCVQLARASNISYTYDLAGRLVTTDYGTNRTTSYVYDNAGNLLQTATPAPGLAIRPNGNQVTLSWPISPAGFGLFSSSVLGPGAQWNNVSGTLFPTGDLNTITVPTNGGSMFYRLQK